MKILLTLFLALFLGNLFSQVRFEPGYFIDNVGEKVECLIKNQDWGYNPSVIEYKLTEEGEILTTNAFYLKEFSIGEELRYVSQTLNIDQSSEIDGFLSRQRNPEWEEQTVFLKTLIKGKYSLYSYVTPRFTKYFYQIDDKKIEQLIYKLYLTSDDKLRDNTQFHQQLINSMVNTGIEKSKILTTLYKKQPLVNLFKLANKGEGIRYTDFRQSRKLFNVHLKAKTGRSDILFENNFDVNANFQDIMFYGFGAEIEYILPVNKNRWMVYLDPAYRYMYTEEVFSNENDFFDEYVGIVDYQAIEIPLGIKYNLNLTKNFALYATVFGLVDIQLSESIIMRQTTGERILGNFGQSNYYGAGVGMRIYNRVLLEGKYYGTATPMDTDKIPFPYFSLNLGVTLFSVKS